MPQCETIRNSYLALIYVVSQLLMLDIQYYEALTKIPMFIFPDTHTLAAVMPYFILTFDNNFFIPFLHELHEAVLLLSRMRHNNKFISLLMLSMESPDNEGIPDVFGSKFHVESPATFFSIIEINLRKISLFISRFAVSSRHPRLRSI